MEVKCCRTASRCGPPPSTRHDTYHNPHSPVAPQSLTASRCAPLSAAAPSGWPCCAGKTQASAIRAGKWRVFGAGVHRQCEFGLQMKPRWQAGERGGKHIF
eukprot:65226-Chlamydomonas_euryale.AAC.1